MDVIKNKYKHIRFKTFTAILLASLFVSACGGGGSGGPGSGGGNNTPIAVAGNDQTVNEGVTVQLAENGNNMAAVTYNWSQTSGSAVMLSSDSVANPTFIAPQVATGSTDSLTFVLTVTNNGGQSASDTVNVVVNDVVSTLPVANAGVDQSVSSGSNVQLSGSGSGGNPPFTFSWVQTSGTTVSLSDNTIANPLFTSPVITAGNTETLGFDLTVMDANGSTSTDSINVVIMSTPTNLRIKEISFDYDNDGTTDATETYTYDSTGRVTKTDYKYTGDNSADKFVRIEGNSRVFDIIYDANGRVQSHEFDDNNVKLLFQFTYNNSTGQVTRTDQTVTFATGQVSSQYHTHTYNGTQILQINQFDTNNNLLLTTDYLYSSQGRVVDEIGNSITGDSTAARYTMDTNNRLDLWEIDFKGDGSFEWVNDYIYDTNSGLLDKIVKTNTDPFAGQYENYTETYNYDSSNMLSSINYDNNNDGSDDATATVTRTETGPCHADYSPVLFAKVGVDGNPASNNGDFAWCN